MICENHLVKVRIGPVCHTNSSDMCPKFNSTEVVKPMDFENNSWALMILVLLLAFAE